MPERFQSAALAAVHEGISDLRKVGAVNEITMRTFDVLCLEPIENMTPRKIRALPTRRIVAKKALGSLAQGLEESNAIR